MLAASNIAAGLADDRLPSPKDLFVLSAAIAAAASAGDQAALRAGLDGARALLDELPRDAPAGFYRGYLSAMSEFAWLLNSQAEGVAPDLAQTHT